MHRTCIPFDDSLIPESLATLPLADWVRVTRHSGGNPENHGTTCRTQEAQLAAQGSSAWGTESDRYLRLVRQTEPEQLSLLYDDCFCTQLGRS